MIMNATDESDCEVDRAENGSCAEETCVLKRRETSAALSVTQI